MKRVKQLQRCDDFGDEWGRGKKYRANRQQSSMLTHVLSQEMCFLVLFLCIYFITILIVYFLFIKNALLLNN
jgi:hypothetical protein